MAEILRSGPLNPLIEVSGEEFVAWLREKADQLGLSDRATCGVQLSFTGTDGTVTHHWVVPEIVFMVSNIPNSRGKTGEQINA